MIRYSAKRLARSMLTLFIIITVVFSLLRLMPVEGYFQNYEKMNDAQIQNGLRQLGLLDPLPVQLMNFYKQVLHGDLGVSNIYRMNVPITQIVAEKAPVSMMMGGMALCISLLLGLPMGAAMARGKGKWFDKIGTGSSCWYRRCQAPCIIWSSSCTARRYPAFRSRCCSGWTTR